MDKILIINKRPDFVKELKIGLKPYQSQFELLFESSVEEAIPWLRKGETKALITELGMPETDALSIIVYMSNNFSQVPCISIIEEDRSDIYIDSEDECYFNYVKKPIVFDDLANAIMHALDRYDECTPLTEQSGLPLSILLQVIENEKQTRLLEIRSTSDEKGFIYFFQGVLFSAVCGSLKGEAAILEMLTWNKTWIDFKQLPKGKIKRQIYNNIIDLLPQNENASDKTSYSNEDYSSESIDENAELPETEFEGEKSEEYTEGVSATSPENENDMKERRKKKMALENEIFEALKKISGFVGSIVYSGTGEVLLADAPDSINADEVGGLAIELYKNARAIAEQMKMGMADLVEVRTESHYFLHACIVPGKGALGVLMRRDGNVGLMRHTMRRISESLVPDFS